MATTTRFDGRDPETYAKSTRAATGSFEGQDFWKGTGTGLGAQNPLYDLRESGPGQYVARTRLDDPNSWMSGITDAWFAPQPPAADTPPAGGGGGGAPPALQQLAQGGAPPTAAGLNEGGMTPIDMGLGMRTPPVGGSALAQLAAKKGRIY